MPTEPTPQSNDADYVNIKSKTQPSDFNHPSTNADIEKSKSKHTSDTNPVGDVEGLRTKSRRGHSEMNGSNDHEAAKSLTKTFPTDMTQEHSLAETQRSVDLRDISHESVLTFFLQVLSLFYNHLHSSFLESTTSSFCEHRFDRNECASGSLEGWTFL